MFCVYTGSYGNAKLNTLRLKDVKINGYFRKISNTSGCNQHSSIVKGNGHRNL